MLLRVVCSGRPKPTLPAVPLTSSPAPASSRTPGPLTVMRLGHHESAAFRDIAKGRFHNALKHRTTMLRIQGVACEADEQCRMLKAFATSPDMGVTARREATIPYAISDGHLFVPLTINRRSAIT